MKRIMIFISSGKAGGIEIASFNLIKIFSDLGYEVKVVKISGGNNDILKYDNEKILLKKKRKDESIFSKIIDILKTIKRLRTEIKAYNPNITISNGDYCNTMSALTFTDEKKIGTIHSIKSIELKNQGLFGKICLFGIKYLYKYFFKIVCISEGIKQDIIKNFPSVPREKLEVVYNYHDFENIKIKSEEELDSEFEKELFKKDIIIFVGRIVKTKAPWHLIKSFSVLKEKNPNLKLIFLGPGDQDLLEKLNKLLESLKIENSVFFLGKKANPYKYIKKSKVLAMTSYFEGLPNVIVEALSLNIPVITTDCTLGVWEALADKNQKSQKFKQNGFEIFENGIIVKNFKEENFINEFNSEITEEEYIFANLIGKILEREKNLKKEENLIKFTFKKVKEKYLSVIER